MSDVDIIQFKADLTAFSERILSVLDVITTEESTKTALVMPFFQMLGYDVFDPREFMPEFTADVGIKKGEKVDYAVCQAGQPVVIIEVKSVGTVLDGHMSQLFRYFNTVSARLAILTDGVEYRFYTDLDAPNRMDSEPFLVVNLCELTDDSAELLAAFHKSVLDVDFIRDMGFRLKYRQLFLANLHAELDNPTDAFISACLGPDFLEKKTAAVLRRFRPILQEALAEFCGMDVTCRSHSEALPSVPEKPVRRVRQHTERPEMFFITDRNGRTEYEFKSFKDAILTVCAHCISMYGADMFSEKCCGHDFFGPTAKARTFSMQESDMRGRSFYRFPNGLYLLTNYSAKALGSIGAQLLELFPDVKFEY